MIVPERRGQHTEDEGSAFAAIYLKPLHEQGGVASFAWTEEPSFDQVGVVTKYVPGAPSRSRGSHPPDARQSEVDEQGRGGIRQWRASGFVGELPISAAERDGVRIGGSKLSLMNGAEDAAVPLPRLRDAISLLNTAEDDGAGRARIVVEKSTRQDVRADRARVRADRTYREFACHDTIRRRTPVAEPHVAGDCQAGSRAEATPY
ncbi:hypothetical protein [Methylorubrum thiocyanatum]|uniref:hypothetical protein n=1 Tax=Methylorubrum thiocyanatum TaxID=47958 RepID=UPI003F7E85F3